MKIQKYQGGAIIYTPSPRPTAETASTTSTSSSTASKKDKITGTIQKEIMDLLKNDGLPSDVHQLLTVASGYLDKSSRLTDMSLFGGTDKDYSLQDYIKILDLVQEVKFNKEQYDDAAETLTKEDAWGDVATTTNGDIWVQTIKDGKASLATVSPDEFAARRKDENFRKSVRVLTNSDLAEYRARNLGFDQSGIIESLAAAKGMKSITEQLRAVVKDFEANEQQYYKFSHGADRIQDKTGKTYSIQSIKDGLDALTSNGPSGYYKITQKIKYDENNISDALTYLWNSLGNDAQRAIEAKLAVSGDDPDNHKNRAKFLLDVISFGAGNAIQVDFDSAATSYDPNGTGKKGGSTADKGDQLVQLNYLGMIASGQYGNPRKINLTGKTATVTKSGKIEAIGYDLGAMIGHNKETLNKQTVSSLLANAWGLQVGNTGSITFGNRHISAEEAQALYWNGADHLNLVKLPATRDFNGNIVPDLELSQKVMTLNEKAKGRTDAEVKKYIETNLAGYEVEKNDKGVWEIKNVPTMSFLTFRAIASDKIFKFTDEEKLMLDHIDKDQGRIIESIYNTLVKYNTLNPNNNTHHLDFKDAGKNSFYSGNVYIPIDDQYAGWAVSGNEPYVTKDSLSNAAEKIQIKEAAQSRQGTLKTKFE